MKATIKIEIQTQYPEAFRLHLAAFDRMINNYLVGQAYEVSEFKIKIVEEEDETRPA